MADRDQHPSREDYSSLIAARCLALPGKLIDCPVCGAVDNERSRQAREDAQPVAWKFRHVGQRLVGVTMYIKEAELKAASGWEVEPLGLITRPAPDAMRDDHDAVTRTLAALIDPAIDHKLAKQRLMTMRRRAALQAEGDA